MARCKTLVFEYPLSGGGQLKVSACGVWDREDCDTIEEFMPMVVKSMRRRVVLEEAPTDEDKSDDQDEEWI